MAETAVRTFPGSFDDRIDVAIEEYDGTEIDRVSWDETTTQGLVLEIVEKLQSHGKYTAEVNPDTIFERLRDTIRTAIDLRTRTRPGPGDLPPIVEVPNDQWAVTTEGVGCLERNYFIEQERFSEDDWKTHMSEKMWVEFDKFREAFDLAVSMLEREERERQDWVEAPF